jgi:hypothetical protein
MALGKQKANTKSFGFMASKPLAIVYNTSGWIPTALINRIALSFRRPLTLCSAGIAMQKDAMYIWQMF